MSGFRLHNSKNPASFSLRLERIPTYITSPTADLILFLGRAYRTIMSSSNANLSLQANSKDLSTEKHSMAFARLTKMSPFRLTALEDALRDLHQYISNRLWTVILQDCKLADHLRAFKDYFLLGKGEFHDALLEELELISQRSVSTSEYGKRAQGIVKSLQRTQSSVTTSFPEDHRRRRLAFGTTTISDCECKR